MNDPNKINQINKVIDTFFKINPNINKILAKDLMPQFMKEGIFGENEVKGKALRAFFRKFKLERRLSMIPNLSEGRNGNENWYFIKLNSNQNERT